MTNLHSTMTTMNESFALCLFYKAQHTSHATPDVREPRATTSMRSTPSAR